jgi:hypothetical protein
MDSNSRRRAAPTSGYDIFSRWSVSSTMHDTTSRAFSLSSAGTTYHGASSVLVAPRHSP